MNQEDKTMADFIMKEKEVKDFCKWCEKKYPKGIVIDILIKDGKKDKNHIIYTVHEGKK